MGVRVIHRTDVYSLTCGPENFTSIINNQLSPPPPHDTIITKQKSEPIPSSMNIESTTSGMSNNLLSSATIKTTTATISDQKTSSISSSSSPITIPTDNNQNQNQNATTITPSKHKKSERIDSFSKLRLSPKSFRFSSRFGRSKSEAEKVPNDPFYNYSKSFQDVSLQNRKFPNLIENLLIFLFLFFIFIFVLKLYSMIHVGDHKVQSINLFYYKKDVSV